jgi:hypothetical protein
MFISSPHSSKFIFPISTHIDRPLYKKERDRKKYTHNDPLFFYDVYTNGSEKETIIFATSGLIKWFAGISPELTIFLILVPLSSSLNSGP